MKTIQELNEFTWDMVRTLPIVYYLHKNNIDYKVICKRNLSNIYNKFNGQVFETDSFNPINPLDTYTHKSPLFTKLNWCPPPLKEMYSNILNFEKPVIVIQNKYSIEWGQGAFNYLSIDFLDKIITEYKEKYTIIYVRPSTNEKSYYYDNNPILEFKDYDFLEKNHPDVITIKKLQNLNPQMDYNSLQFSIHASSEKHISVSGGNACVAAYFGGDLIIFDSPEGEGANRGIWKTDSWLKLLGNSNIYGFNNYDDIISFCKKKWNS